MRRNLTSNLWAYTILVGLVGVGVVIGVLSARGIYHAGQGLFASLVIGVIEGLLGFLGAYIVLQLVFRVISLVRFLLHKRMK